MTEERWRPIKQRLAEDLDEVEFSTWFAPLRVHSEQDHRLVLAAPNQHFVHTLEQSYRPAIDQVLIDLGEGGLELLFTVASDDYDEIEDTPPEPATATSTANFDSRYRFANFVVGNSNQFAHAAAESVAKTPAPASTKPAEGYNPLFLYGDVGLGKTHLMHAIGHEIRRKYPQLRLMYLPAEQFVNELINSIRFERMHAFRERYRTIDVLLIDDIQFLANKERTQEEFFHTFNTLYTAKKQIVVSSDAPPRQIPTIEDRLRSRFEWGLIADIQPPDLETKIAILRRKADLDRIHLPNEVAEFIARYVKSNVRELEGMLNRVNAFASFTGKPLSLELTKETLKDVLPPEEQRVTAPEIIKVVARHYGLKVQQIKSKSNSKQIAFPRQVAMYLCKKLTQLSYPDIGRQFNGKHHSTVMYSVDKIEGLREKEPEIDRAVKSLMEHFS
ncbi:MAG: chromosomal replication initiator protein DnaA [Acidobacteriota bacterium]